MTLKQQLAERKEVIRRKRAAKGEAFTGSAKLRKERATRYKLAGKKQSVTIRQIDTDFMLRHGGLNYDEWFRAVDRGYTLEDVNQWADKSPLMGVDPGQYPQGVHKNIKRRAKQEGLMVTKGDNNQVATYHNPRGAGALSTGEETDTLKVLALADRMQGIDLTSITGLYDTKYSPEIKLHAVITWLLTGNLSKTERILDLKKGLVASWKQRADWWPALTAAIQKERGEELDHELTTLISDTTTSIKERLENGDWKYNPKLDKLVRVPVQAKEAAIIMDKAIGNRNLLRGDPTSRSESVSVKEHLTSLRQEFERFAAAKTVEGVIETSKDNS